MLKAAAFDDPLGAGRHEVHLLGGRALGGCRLPEAHEGHAAAGVGLAVNVLGQRLQGGDLHSVE